MARTRKNNSVISTIEALTGKRPCPEYLRNSLNKYLRVKNLFPGSEKRAGKTEKGKLERPITDTLVVNVLSLDEAFRGETDLVAKIINKEISQGDLASKIDAAEQELARRLEIYGYWVQRMKSLKVMLSDQSFDLKTTRIDERLRNAEPIALANEPAAFAMRAITQLEQSEERGRLGRPSADEYVERADAYLALGNLALADRNARNALETNNAHSKAWFIRVMVALRLRNGAVREMQRQQMIAQEVAEPMSSQESWAYELADEEASKASAQHLTLAEILPKALLHWPKQSDRRYDHPDQRTQVRDLFISQAFGNSIHGSSRRHVSSRHLHCLNGMEAEWQLQYEGSFMQSAMEFGEKRLPFEDEEIKFLKILFEERDHPFPWFFYPLDPLRFAKDLKLLHLRWVLDDAGYDKHWRELNRDIAESPASWLEQNILCDTTLSQIWHLHLCLNEGDNAVLSNLDRWQAKAASRSEDDRDDRRLTQYALLFHRQFARKKFSDCAAICRTAINSVFKSNPHRGAPGQISHPYSDAVSMRIGHRLYWEYLEALSTIRHLNAGSLPTDTEVSLLLRANSLRESFRDTSHCFWQESEEYEGGGGEDWDVEPYEMDLRGPEIWLETIEPLLLAERLSRYAVDLQALVAELSKEVEQQQTSR